jgi:hypothetical protein
MVGSSKILTVSYGTFSCTLEGFEDPFSTMKSIAEYFRDLAADDRYFGAEPPTPDAEMLHRIAEREVQRRVEARMSSGGIVLRQLAEEDADSPEDLRPQRRDVAWDSARPAPAAREHGAPGPAAPDESVAAKLSRIRAVVDRARAASMPAQPVAAPPMTPPAATSDDDYIEEAAEAETPLQSGIGAEESRIDDPRPTLAAVEDDDAEEDDTPRPWATGGTAESWSDPVEATHAPAEATDDDDIDAAEDEADFDSDEDEGDFARRIVQLSHSGSRSVRDTDDTDDRRPDDSTLAGIRMALNVEAEAMAQERKEARLERRHVLIGGGPEKEPAFDRILEETNTKMADREGTRRRSAIAHLKAAVAATKADRMLKRERSRELDEEEQSAYREDLAKVVRPHRSEPREIVSSTARPASLEETGAPLILASSQRVDSETGAASKLDLRPRRIGAGMLALDEDDSADMDEGDDDSAFAEFAESVGARDLPDLLEAAAAYTAFVERQPTFSRPQIMRRAAAVETDEEFTREAGLRSFGQLLRQGKIRKLQRGQFTISENTRFRPEARIAGE